MRKDGGYTGVWRPGVGEQHWVGGFDHDDFKQRDTEYFKKGLRLVAMHISNDEYTGVWRPGAGEQHWHTGLGFDEFKQKDKEYFDKGLRLITMESRYGGDGIKFMGVWRPGTGAQRWWTEGGDKFDEFKKKDLEHFNQGLRLIAFPPYGLNAIWHPGSGDQWVKFAVSLDEFKKADKEYFEQGLRLVDLSVGA